MAHVRLGELLISAGLISQDDLSHALATQSSTRERLGTILTTNGTVTENALAHVLQSQLCVEFIDLSKVHIPVEMAQILSKTLAMRYEAVPVRVSGEKLFLAMSDPMNFYALEDMRVFTHKHVVPMIATRSGVRRAIQILYSNDSAAKAIADMQRESANKKHDFSEEAVFITMSLEDGSVTEAPSVRLVNIIMERAVLERASDIHLEPHEENLTVRLRVDGHLRTVLTIPREVQSFVLSRIKVLSGMDIAERRVPQDGHFSIHINERDIDLRVSTLPTVYGEKVVVRLLDKSGGRVTKESIGLCEKDLELYDRLMCCHSGMILLAGPTGSGKTTTMYAMINQLNTPEVNIVTLEDPVEYHVDGVNQVQINGQTGLTFATGLRAILRQDPDILAIGEIRDSETAEIAVRAAITGHLVLSTVHTGDCVGVVERLLDIGTESYMIASALRGVISQRLVRRICPSCRRSYRPSPKEIAELGLPEHPDTLFYYGEGCPECFGTGYLGRTAVFEIMPVTRKIRSVISEKRGRDELERELHSAQRDFNSLRENAVRLVREGVTTVSEAMQIIYEIQ